MNNADRRVQQKFCNCKNSKCMKLYCDCFSARVPCGKSCRCVGCQNTTLRQAYQEKFYPDKRMSREELIRMHKGCACRRSNCTKKYCDCFQSGILCKDTCKCVDCQNNESLTNRKVIEQLRNKNSDQSNNQNSINLYSLYISQNSEHLQSIITQSNPLRLEEGWLDECAQVLFGQVNQGDEGLVIDRFLQILIDLQGKMGDQISYKGDFSQEIQEEDEDKVMKENQIVEDEGNGIKDQAEHQQNKNSQMQQEYSIQQSIDQEDQDRKNSSSNRGSANQKNNSNNGSHAKKPHQNEENK